MKCLAIDSSISKITISARNEDITVSAVFDIGMKQSETLLPAIEYVLSKAGLSTSELESLALSSGPGSFTGLRLGFSALKAIELAFKIPLYGFNTLDVYAEPYKGLTFPVISCIDAKKDRFYAKGFNKNEELFPAGDLTPEEISSYIENISEEKVFICGSDAELLSSSLKNVCKKEFIPFSFTINAGEVLLSMTEKAIAAGFAPLNEYDGPVYLRASEAELKLQQ